MCQLQVKYRNAYIHHTIAFHSPQSCNVKNLKIIRIDDDAVHHSVSPGGLWNAVHEAVHLGARSFAMFLKPQRTWNCKPLTDEDAERFKHTLKVPGKYNFNTRLTDHKKSYVLVKHIGV